jgi:hypothetical protein
MKKHALMFFAALTASAEANANTASWSYEFGASEGLHKLMYVPDGANHGDIYMRCLPENGL